MYTVVTWIAGITLAACGMTGITCIVGLWHAKNGDLVKMKKRWEQLEADLVLVFILALLLSFTVAVLHLTD